MLRAVPSTERRATISRRQRPRSRFDTRACRRFEAVDRVRWIRPMTKREVLGTALVGVGVVGVMLPLVPGWPFLLAAVAVLGPNHRLTRPFKGLVQRGHSLFASGYARLGGSAAPPGRSGARRAARQESPGTGRATPPRAGGSTPAKRGRGRRTRTLTDEADVRSIAAVKPPERAAQRGRRSGAPPRLVAADGESASERVTRPRRASPGALEEVPDESSQR